MLLRSFRSHVLLLSFLLPCLCLAQGSSSAPSSPDPVEIVRSALEKFQARSTEALNYVFREHEVLHVFGQNGKLTVSDTYQIMFIEGNPYRVHVEHNNQPIPEEEVEKEKKHLEELARKYHEEARMVQQQRSQYAEVYSAAWSKPRVPEISLEGLPDSHKLRLLGTESADGMAAYVVEARPRSDHSTSKDATFQQET